MKKDEMMLGKVVMLIILVVTLVTLVVLYNHDKKDQLLRNSTQVSAAVECVSTCAVDECDALTGNAKQSCLLACFAGKCTNEGAEKMAEKTGMPGIGCISDGICNEFCAIGADSDCKELDCSNGEDDDNDGATDCADSDCDLVGFCEGLVELTCDDNSDNDGDGKIDCNDSDCSAAPICGPAPSLLFVATRDGSSEIYSVNADGTNQVNLTNNAARDFSAAYSPDRTKIAFSSNRDGNHDLYIMDADGSNVVNITNDTGFAAQVAWSPDGLKLAFSRGFNEIFTIDIDGTNEVNLTNNPARDENPSWSPDSLQIAFTSNRDVTKAIYVMNADGSNVQRIGRGKRADWSPDGTKFVLFASGIAIMDLNGSTTVLRVGTSDTPPKWSPNGGHIAFGAFTVLGGQDVFIMRANGTNVVRITTHPFVDASPEW